MSTLTLKLKTKNGQHIIKTASLTTTILEFKEQISSLVNISPHNMIILIGFPPKQISSGSMEKNLGDLNIKTGDTLIVEESAISTAPLYPAGAPSPAPPAKTIGEEPLDGLLMRQVVPADNSCLFTSVGFVLGGKVDTAAQSYMRQIIADQVASDEEQYNEAILGKPNDEYCEWILKPESWGGAIEVAVLSNFYGLEIAVIDTMNAVINRFGEDKNYKNRVFLIFDGIHYDPIYREPLEPGGAIQTIFSTSNDTALKRAEELAQEAKASKQYTDLDKFTIRCLVCDKRLTGQVQAQLHAQATGHQNFGEIPS